MERNQPMKRIVCFTMVCVIIYALASCNTFFKFSHSSSNVENAGSTWLAKIVQDGNQHELETLTLHFSSSGRVLAKCATCDVNGFWYEDEISDKFIMSFEPNQVLCELNKSWDVQLSGSSKIILKSPERSMPLTLTLSIP